MSCGDATNQRKIYNHQMSSNEIKMNACHPGLSPGPRPKALPVRAPCEGRAGPGRARLPLAMSSHHVGLFLFRKKNQLSSGVSKGQITGLSPRQMGILEGRGASRLHCILKTFPQLPLNNKISTHPYRLFPRTATRQAHARESVRLGCAAHEPAEEPARNRSPDPQWPSQRCLAQLK